MNISKELETDRLVLRQLDENFFTDYTHLMMNDETNRFSDWPNFERSDEDVLLLGIVLKLGEIFIGSCGLMFLDIKDEYECFYALFPQYWGNGYSVESMKRVFDYAFDDLEAKKISIYINPKNTRAWKVAERSGMKYLGQYILDKTKNSQMLYTIEEKDFKIQRY